MKRIHKIIRVVWITGGLLFSLWLISSFQAKGFDVTVLESDSKVTVEETRTSIRFTPTQNLQTTGLLFYPGGMVDPDAYAPMARAFAESGYTVIILKLPLRTAPFAALEEQVFEQTQSFMAENRGVEKWVLGGHSRGAAIAVRFAHQFPDLLDGLVLMGTSHPKESAFDLAAMRFPVMKIYATNDGLASVEEVQANAIYLPGDTIWVEIDGGNHAQFGYYGKQLGDGEAEISREDQQAQISTAILQLFSLFSNQN